MKKSKVAKNSGKTVDKGGRPRLSKGGTTLFTGTVTVELAALVEAKRRSEGLSRSAALRAALEAWVS